MLKVKVALRWRVIRILDIVVVTGVSAELLLADLRSMGYRARKSAPSICLDSCRNVDICVISRPNVSAVNATLAELRKNEIAAVSVAAMLPRPDMEALDYQLVDEVIIVPYDLKELDLKLRLKHFQRYNNGHGFASEGLMLDVDGRDVVVDGRSLSLTFKEFELLKTLMASPGRVLSRSYLVNNIWHHDYVSGKRLVDVHVRRLRAKLGAQYGDRIQTVRNVGYCFRQT